jgi:crossover junction endodeoxyribonuclease RusA
MSGSTVDEERAPFVLILDERPLSQQARFKSQYQQRVQIAAKKAFDGQPVFPGDVYVRITYCQSGPPRQDIDNIIKPLLDALKGVIFADDVFVRQCTAERIFLDRSFTISDRFRSDEGFRDLSELLDQGVADILFIEVGTAPAQHMTFGPLMEVSR